VGREVRRVPANWEHPKRSNGQYIPLNDGYTKRLHDWEEGKSQWEKGLYSDFSGGWEPISEAYRGQTWEEYDGERPDPKDYMPDWPEDERTHWQMYEDTSEGTPISPVMPDPESLARWLADNDASAFADMTATYEQWLATIQRGWAPSAIFSPATGLISGVEAKL